MLRALRSRAATSGCSGDALDGVYQATITLPADSEQGTWTVNPVGLYDKAGNHTSVQSPTLAAARYPATIEVVRAG